MKKIVSVILTLALALGTMLSLVSCSDGKLTEKEWEAAFDFENVTIELVEGETKSDAEVTGEIYVVDGDWYMVEAGIVINFTEDYEDSYSNSVASNFQLLTMEDVGVYGNLDNDKYEELFIPEYEDLGLTVTDWNVVRKNNGELNVLVITQLASVAGIQFNQALLVVDVGDTIVQITCTVYEGSSDGFIDVIFESLRLAD